MSPALLTGRLAPLRINIVLRIGGVRFEVSQKLIDFNRFKSEDGSFKSFSLQ